MAIGVCGSAATFSASAACGIRDALTEYVKNGASVCTDSADCAVSLEKLTGAVGIPNIRLTAGAGLSDTLREKLESVLEKSGCNVSIDDILDYITSNKPSVKPSPDEPSEPDEPSTPDEPDVPATPDVPSTPDEPSEPDVPSTPDVPTTPDDSEKPGSGTTQSDFASEVIRLVNVERTKAGLSPVSEGSSALVSAANKRAEEVAKVFSHTRPDGSSCFTVLGEYGVSYRSAGENIASGQTTPAEVVNAWMNSEGHRANILGANFTSLGVGVYKNGGSYTWVQLFIS